MDSRCDHSSGVDDDLVVELGREGFMVQVIQDVNSRYTPPPAVWSTRPLELGSRQYDSVGEDIVLKHVAQVSAMFLLQHWQQLLPAGDTRFYFISNISAHTQTHRHTTHQ